VNYEGETVFELGEQAALARATKYFKSAASTLVGTGDDAAVVAVSDGRFVVTTDSMVEGRDFRIDFSSGFDIGYKAVTTNLADVVAMGAKPVSLVVALLVTNQTKSSWLEDFAMGMQAAIDELSPGAEVVGGDLASAQQLVIAVTAHGDLEGRSPILRSGAKPGDVIAVAGTLGKAACGLNLLLHTDRTLSESYPELVEVQLRPKPPISIALSAKQATAMMDISDSLALDANRMARASNVQINIQESNLLGYVAVLEQAAQSLASRGEKVDPLDWVLYGGEDHGFLATFNKSEVPVGFRVIGQVTEGSGVLLDGVELEARGWDSVSSQA
jgi:thiamine-monophosphate kinase